MDAVIGGHDHDYERLIISNVAYFVNGLGGAGSRDFDPPLPGSQIRYNATNGGMIISADDSTMNFKFYSDSNRLIDEYTLTQ